MKNVNPRSTVSLDARQVAYKLSQRLFEENWYLPTMEPDDEVVIAHGAYMLQLGIDLANYDHKVRSQYITDAAPEISGNKTDAIKAADSCIKPLNDR